MSGTVVGSNSGSVVFSELSSSASSTSFGSSSGQKLFLSRISAPAVFAPGYVAFPMGPREEAALLKSTKASANPISSSWMGIPSFLSSFNSPSFSSPYSMLPRTLVDEDDGVMGKVGDFFVLVFSFWWVVDGAR